MGLTVPQAITALLDEVENAGDPIDEMGLADQLRALILDSSALSADEKQGAWAELEAFRFQPRRAGQPGPWNMYWGSLASWVTEAGTEVQSPDARTVTADILGYWMTRAENAAHPVLQARYADLAWEVGRFLKSQQDTDGTVASVEIAFTLAQRAIDGYLAAVERSLHHDEYDAWQYLDRAISLATSINDIDRTGSAKKGIFALYRNCANSGVKFKWWWFDDLTWNHAKALNLAADEKKVVLDALEEVLAKSADISDPQRFDPHNATAAADRLARRRAQMNEPAEARRAMTTAARAFEEAAKLADGLTAIAWLEDLIPRYRNAGLAEDAARVEQTIRSRADEARSGMAQVEVPVSVPKEELETWADKIAGATLEEGIARLAYACLVKEESTQQSLKSMHENAPLSAIMSSSIMTADGFTTAKVGSIADDLDGRSIQHAATLLGWHAPWLSFALNRIKEKHGLDLDKLMGILRQCPFFASHREVLLNSGVSAWFDDDPTKAIGVLVPQIEPALRDLLAALGAPVMVPDPDSGGFQAIGFGKIINHPVFRAKVPKDLRFHLRALYCDPRGVDVRNELAHGLMHPEMFNVGLANWVIHTVLLISTLRLQSPSQQSC